MSNSRHYCTYFDTNYATRGLALLESLERLHEPFVLWILCMDDPVYALALKLGSAVRAIKLQDLEAWDPGLAAVRAARSPIEYYFTCTPALPLFILASADAPKLVTYVDADLYFFSSPEPVFEEFGDNSVGIVPHGFSPNLRSSERFGSFNVGYLTFRNDSTGLAVLNDWASRCKEWCYDRLEGDRFADQLYLDAWPKTFPGIHIFTHPGLNLAPWNLGGRRLGSGMPPEVDGRPIIAYHFHGLRVLGSGHYELGLAPYRTRATARVRELLYKPYLDALARAGLRAARLGLDTSKCEPLSRSAAPPSERRIASACAHRTLVQARTFFFRDRMKYYSPDEQRDRRR